MKQYAIQLYKRQGQGQATSKRKVVRTAPHKCARAHAASSRHTRQTLAHTAMCARRQRTELAARRRTPLRVQVHNNKYHSLVNTHPDKTPQCTSTSMAGESEGQHRSTLCC